MKWLIASDIHGSVYYCRKVLECFAREGAERLLLLGDVLYHGPRNDLPRDYAPKEVAAQLNAMADRVLGVRGNCDAEIDQAVLAFPIMADYACSARAERAFSPRTATCSPPTACRRCTRERSCCRGIRTSRSARKEPGSSVSIPARPRSPRRARRTAV